MAVDPRGGGRLGSVALTLPSLRPPRPNVSRIAPPPRVTPTYSRRLTGTGPEDGEGDEIA